MRFVILHYHIFKNAGSTIENILDEYFGERFCRVDTANRDACFSNSAVLSHLRDYPQLSAISSHQIRYPVPTAPGFLFFDLCFLRDPLDRIGSTYFYLREKPAEADPLSELANQFELGEFIMRAVERMPHQVSNVQVSLLANDGSRSGNASREDLDCAIGRMFNTSFLGVVDCFDESLIAGQFLLKPIFPGFDCAQLPVNVSNRLGATLDARLSALKKACGDRAYSELVRLNALDSELVRRARMEVTRRFALVADGALRLEALQKRMETLFRYSRAAFAG